MVLFIVKTKYIGCCYCSVGVTCSICFTAIPTHYRYFSLQASEQLGLGDSVRLDVENKICDEHGPRMDSFAVPQKKAYDIMNKV